jgi:hypothetical protein
MLLSTQPPERITMNEHHTYHALRRIAAPFLMAMLFGSTLASRVHAAVVTNVNVPLDTTVFVPCANGGAGENVHLSGPHHMLISLTSDARGALHAHFTFNPQGIHGIGSITGRTYQGVGKTEGNFNGNAGSTNTLGLTFDLVGQGPGNDLKVHETMHVTVRADGTVTASVDDFRLTCS